MITPVADTEVDAEGPSWFSVTSRDAATRARTGTLRTRRGVVHTPAFMPVGTVATVKSLTPAEVRLTGAEILLANTYHLMLRPGVEVIRAAGGLHRFMAWDGPILTDSGGYQVLSLAQRRDVREEGVRFRSHLDGSTWELTPETAIDLQLDFQSDLIMPLDDVVGFGAAPAEQRLAMERTYRWLARAVDHFHAAERGADSVRPRIFGIAQGGFDPGTRAASAASLGGLPLDGSAIGGLSVGEPKTLTAELLAASVEGLPGDRPRYLMGVGSPEDLWSGVAAGIDMFDCVHPTRVARRGGLFTPEGRINVTASRFRSVFGPIEDGCDCETCRTFTVAYLHHLFRSRELLAYRLASIHNLRFVQRQMCQIRRSIQQGDFAGEMVSFLERYQIADRDAAALQRQRLRARGDRRREAPE